MVNVTFHKGYSLQDCNAPANGDEIHIRADDQQFALRVAAAAVRLYGGQCWKREGYCVYTSSYGVAADLSALDFAPAIAKVVAEEAAAARAAIDHARNRRMRQLKMLNTNNFIWSEMVAHVTEIANLALGVDDATPVRFYRGGGSGGNAHYYEQPREVIESTYSRPDGEHRALRQVTFVSDSAQKWCEVYCTVGVELDGVMRISGWQATPPSYLPSHPRSFWNDFDPRD